MTASDVRRVLYLCDGRACGDACPNELCHHTTRLEHALHAGRDTSEFIVRPSPVEGKVDLWEPTDG